MGIAHKMARYHGTNKDLPTHIKWSEKKFMTGNNSKKGEENISVIREEELSVTLSEPQQL